MNNSNLTIGEYIIPSCKILNIKNFTVPEESTYFFEVDGNPVETYFYLLESSSQHIESRFFVKAFNITLKLGTYEIMISNPSMNPIKIICYIRTNAEAVYKEAASSLGNNDTYSQRKKFNRVIWA